MIARKVTAAGAPVHGRVCLNTMLSMPVSYVYLPYATQGAHTTVVFNHLPGGSNVLFMDGHVEFIRFQEKAPIQRFSGPLQWGTPRYLPASYWSPAFLHLFGGWG